MGYTHYWSHEEIGLHDWAALMNAVRSIMRESGDIRLANWDGNGSPEISGSRIALNGSETHGEDHESFVLTRDATGFDFCKTARKPYDAIVCAILIRASVIVAGFSVRSDGSWDSDEWPTARHLYASVFGVEPVKPEGIRP